MIRWHVLRSVSSAVADEQLRGAATPTTVGSLRVHVLHPADALLERLWASSSERSPGWIADAVQLARRLTSSETGDHSADRFADRARALGLDSVVRRRLALVADVVPDPAVLRALDALDRHGSRLAEVLWRLPSPADHLGRAWAGHAAGQGMVGGARSLLGARWAGRRLT